MIEETTREGLAYLPDEERFIPYRATGKFYQPLTLTGGKLLTDDKRFWDFVYALNPHRSVDRRKYRRYRRAG